MKRDNKQLIEDRRKLQQELNTNERAEELKAQQQSELFHKRREMERKKEHVVLLVPSDWFHEDLENYLEGRLNKDYVSPFNNKAELKIKPKYDQSKLQ